MTVTINNVRAQFHLSPPIITFLQGANMGVPTIRNTLRQIEETEEGRGQSFRQIVTASGNLDFSENMDGSSASALTIRVLAPYVCAFEAGPIPFNSTLGNILFTSVQSPGAVVKINNAVGAMLVSTGGAIPTPAQIAAAVWNEQLYNYLGTLGSAGKSLRELFLCKGLDHGNPLVVDTVSGSRRVPADGSIIEQTLTVEGPGVGRIART